MKKMTNYYDGVGIINNLGDSSKYYGVRLNVSSKGQAYYSVDVADYIIQITKNQRYTTSEDICAKIAAYTKTNFFKDTVDFSLLTRPFFISNNRINTPFNVCTFNLEFKIHQTGTKNKKPVVIVNVYDKIYGRSCYDKGFNIFDDRYAYASDLDDELKELFPKMEKGEAKQKTFELTCDEYSGSIVNVDDNPGTKKSTNFVVHKTEININLAKELYSRIRDSSLSLAELEEMKNMIEVAIKYDSFS